MQVNAVFEGGGVKSISLVGAVHAAEQYGITFNRLAGTSSGSIVAAMLAVGYNGSEIRSIIEQMPFQSLLTRGSIYNVRWIGPAMRILLKKGLYSGHALEDWIRQILSKKKVRTFADLPNNKLHIIASDITNGRLLVLPRDIRKLGINPSNFEVAQAIRMSCSIPYFFEPVRLAVSPSLVEKRKGYRKQIVYVVDGGLLSNFPLWLFDKHEPGAMNYNGAPTIGFKMVGKQANQPFEVKGPFTMLQALIETMLSAHDERYLDSEHLFRTVKIPTLQIRPTKFHLTEKEKEELYTSGVNAGQRFFSNWNKEYFDKKLGLYKK